MNKKMLFAIVMFTVVAFGAADLFAWGGGGRGYGYGYSAIPDLTAEQSAKIQSFQKAHLDEIALIQESILKKRTELRSQWLSKNPDQSKIISLQKDISGLESRIQEKSVSLHFEIRKILTPEQQAKSAFGGPGMGKRGRMGGRW